MSVRVVLSSENKKDVLAFQKVKKQYSSYLKNLCAAFGVAVESPCISDEYEAYAEASALYDVDCISDAKLSSAVDVLLTIDAALFRGEEVVGLNDVISYLEIVLNDLLEFPIEPMVDGCGRSLKRMAL